LDIPGYLDRQTASQAAVLQTRRQSIKDAEKRIRDLEPKIGASFEYADQLAKLRKASVSPPAPLLLADIQTEAKLYFHIHYGQTISKGHKSGGLTNFSLFVDYAFRDDL
jgi:hypothetical protein